MYQFYSRPDACAVRCGRLDATVVERSVSGAPSFMRGLRVMFVSDTHVLRRTSRADIGALAAKIAAARPDLLLLGGDYSDRAEDAVRLFEGLRDAVPPMGAFGVLGNNDAEAWRDRLGRLEAVMARAGCRLLRNSAVRLRINGGTLCIGGVDEHRYGAPDAGELYAARPRKDIYRILLSHYPVTPAVSPDLMLCGHTHGGQFNLLGLTPYSIGFERLARPHRASMAVAGLFEIGGMRLLVSKGIGASRLQWRIGVRPEIDLIGFD